MQFLRDRPRSFRPTPLPSLLLAVAVLLGGCGSGSEDAAETELGTEVDDAAEELDSETDAEDAAGEPDSESEDEEEAVVEVDPGTDSSTPEEEAPSEDDVVELEPAEDDSSDTSVDPPSSGDEPMPADGTEILDALIEQMIGLPEDEAIAMAEAEGYPVRIESRNGEEFALTQEFEEGRFNLTIVDDLVESVRIG